MSRPATAPRPTDSAASSNVRGDSDGSSAVLMIARKASQAPGAPWQAVSATRLRSCRIKPRSVPDFIASRSAWSVSVSTSLVRSSVAKRLNTEPIFRSSAARSLFDAPSVTRVRISASTWSRAGPAPGLIALN